MRKLAHNGYLCIVANILAAIICYYLWATSKNNGATDTLRTVLLITIALCLVSAVIIYVTRNLNLSMVFSSASFMAFIYGWSGCYTYYDVDNHLFGGYNGLTIAAIIITAFLCMALYARWVLINNKTASKFDNDSRPNIGQMLGENEVIIKCYHCTNVQFIPRIGLEQDVQKHKKMNASGYVFVTNRRLLYVVDAEKTSKLGSNRSSIFNQHIYIEDICGINASVSNTKTPTVFAILMMMLTMLSYIFILISSASTESSFNLYWIPAVINFTAGIYIILIALIWIYAIRRNVMTSAFFGVICKKQSYGVYVSEKSRGYSNELNFRCSPTPVFEVMSREIGAIVLDLQKYGDDAIDKWR